MSDLQCPAIVLLIPRELLGTLDGDAMRRNNLAGVFAPASSMTEADRSAAEHLAQRAGCRLERLANASGSDDLAQAVSQLSDLYRGENVAVIADAQLIRAALGFERAPTGPVAIAVDASGWAVVDRS
jgi:hypothetical protein